MDRRSFLKPAGLATTAATSTLAAPALAQAKQELKMVMTWDKGFPGLGTGAERFARRVEAATDGRFKITIYGGGELVPPLKCNDAVQDGTADLYHSADYYYQDKSPAYSFFAAVPFGFTANEMDAWLHSGGGQELWDEVGGAFGIKHLACGNTGSQMGGWFTKPITSLDDIKDLRMRIPGMGGEVITAVGGTTVTLGPADILPSLRAGMIDAAEWAGPWNDMALGLYKVAKHYHYPGFHEPGTTVSLGIRRALWESLTGADREVFRACALAENNLMLAEFNANNAQSLETLVRHHGVSMQEFPDQLYRAFGEASRDVIDTIGASDALTNRVYRSFMAFRKAAVAWSRLSDQSYMNKRDLYPF